MGKGGSRNTTTVQEVKIPEFAKEQLMETFDIARDYMPDVYEGQRVAGFTQPELQMQQNLMSYARQPSLSELAARRAVTGISSGRDGINVAPLESAFGRSANLDPLSSSISQRVGLDPLRQSYGQASNLDPIRQALGQSASLSPLQSQMGAQNVATQSLQGMTSAQTTPYLQAAIQNAAEDAAAGITSQFARSGRLGSGAFGSQLGSGIVSAQAPILAEYAQNEANRQLQAAQALGQVSGADLTRQADLASQMVRAQQADLTRQGDLSRQLVAAQQADFTRQGQLASQLASAEQADLTRRGDLSSQMVRAQQADLTRQAGLAGDIADASRAGLESRLRAAGMAPQLQQQLLQREGLLGMVGEAQRSMDQAQLSASQQAIAEQNAANQARLNAMLSAAGVGQGTYGQTSNTTAPRQGGIGSSLGGIGSLLSGGAQVAGLFGVSDMRVKKNIKLVGQTDGGHNLYEWEWTDKAREIGIPLGPEFGVMAQEVMSKKPEAVVEHESGYLMVDYGAID